MILVGTTWHAFNKSAASSFKCSRLSRRPDPIRSSDIVALFYQLSTHITAVNAMCVWSCDRVPICEYGFSRPWVCGFNKFDTADNMLRTCFRIQHVTLVHYMKSRIAHKYPDHFVCKTCCLFSLDIYSSHSMSTAATPLIHSALISIDLHCR